VKVCFATRLRRVAKIVIAADLVGVLAPRTTTHHATIIDPTKVGGLLRAIDGYDGQPITAAALRMAPYVLVRPPPRVTLVAASIGR